MRRLFVHVAVVLSRLCVRLIARKAVTMNDGQRPSCTLGSSPVGVRSLKMDGHLEAIAVPPHRKLQTSFYSAHIRVESADVDPRGRDSEDRRK